MPNPAHDLFLLLLNLSQLKSRELILKTFLDAVNSMFDTVELSENGSSNNRNNEIIEVATRTKCYGRLIVKQTTDSISPEVFPLLRNAVSMLAMILEKHESDCLLSDEKTLLEELVDERTNELLQSNQKLTKEIADRKQAEVNLKNQMAFMNDVLDTQIDTLFLFDPITGKAVRWNKALRDITGYTDEEIRSLPAPASYYSADDMEKAAELVSNVMKEGIGRVELELICKDGRKVPTEYQVSAVDMEEGNQQYLLSIGRDITERKQAEQQKDKLEAQLRQSQKMESVGRLAGGVAHDFNNLLTGITGNVQLAQMDLSSGDPLYDLLSEINEAATRAADLTRQLLAFSRKQIIKPKVINLNDLIEDMRKMLTRVIGEHIDLKVFSKVNLGHIKADQGQIEQIVVNLAVNALDAMPDGGKLSIETSDVAIDDEYCKKHPLCKPGDYVMLAISDTGAGMDMETQQNIFDPFFTTKEEGEGTGLGLATVYGIVKQHDGNIDVYSEVGKGSVFKVYFPRVEEKADSISRKSSLSNLPRGSETVLVVEDESMVRNIAIKILKRQGYNVMHADEGGNAIVMARKRGVPIDLLLTDVVMPNMDGRELADELQGHHPEMKVLFTSGYTEDVIAHHGILDKGLEFIGKPYTPKTLAVKVREVLDK